MTAAATITAENPKLHELADDERVTRLRLLRSENVGPITYHQLIARYGTASAALDALPSLARRGGRSTLRITSHREARDELAALKRTGARLLTHGERLYPDSLAAMPDAPPLISIMGNADLLRRPHRGNSRCPQRVRCRRPIRAHPCGGIERGRFRRRVGPRPRHRHGSPHRRIGVRHDRGSGRRH